MLFWYFEYIVSHLVFEEIEAVLLPVAYPPEDVDQLFRKNSDMLCSNDGVPISDLHFQLKQVYTIKTKNVGYFNNEKVFLVLLQRMIIDENKLICSLKILWLLNSVILI